MARRGQAADEGEGLSCGDGHEAFFHIPHRQQSQAAMIFQQEIMGSIPINHGNSFILQVRHTADVGYFLACEYDCREREIGVGEPHPFMPLGAGCYGSEEIELALFNGAHHLLPGPGFAGFKFNTEQLTHSFQVIGSHAVHAKLLIEELHRRPIDVIGNAEDRVLSEECVFLRGQDYFVLRGQ